MTNTGGGVEFRIVTREQSESEEFLRLDSIPIVSLEDAAFLYREGRINKFVVYEPSEEEKIFLRKAVVRIGIRQDDMLSLMRNG